MFYFSGTDVEVAGASPETLVNLENGVLHTFHTAAQVLHREVLRQIFGCLEVNALGGRVALLGLLGIVVGLFLVSFFVARNDREGYNHNDS